MKVIKVDFKLSQTIKVYARDTQSYIVEIRVTKIKEECEFGYILDIFAAGRLYYINRSIWNTSLEHVNTLVNSLHEVEDRRDGLDKVTLFNEVFKKYR